MEAQLLVLGWAKSKNLKKFRCIRARRKNVLVVKAVAGESGDIGSVPTSATDALWTFGKSLSLSQP